MEEELKAFKTERETQQNKIKQLELQRETLEKEKAERDTTITELKSANTFHPIRLRQLEQQIAKLEKEKEIMKGELTNDNEERRRPARSAHGDEDSIKELKEQKGNLDRQIKDKTGKLKKTKGRTRPTSQGSGEVKRGNPKTQEPREP